MGFEPMNTGLQMRHNLYFQLLMRTLAPPKTLKSTQRNLLSGVKVVLFLTRQSRRYQANRNASQKAFTNLTVTRYRHRISAPEEELYRLLV
jgi:hypothetical protein